MPWAFLSKGGGISYQEAKPGGHGVKEWPRSWKRGQGWPGVGVRWKKYMFDIGHLIMALHALL